jgi:hypothetical protein
MKVALEVSSSSLRINLVWRTARPDLVFRRFLPRHD